MSIHVVWGCNPSFQFECTWLYYLLSPYLSSESYCWSIDHSLPSVSSNKHIFLIESGLARLHTNPSPKILYDLLLNRQRLISHLSSNSDFSLIHISDEEGIDASHLYPLLPKSTSIARNFSHPFLSSYSDKLTSFPIGPRNIFLSHLTSSPVFTSSSKRKYPWAFLGTMWTSGSRKLSVSLFLQSLPSGFFLGGTSFGQGLSLPLYRNKLLSSVFSLAPEGDRHLDTFRLWESLSCGCIPLIVDHNFSASSLLPSNFPVPIFQSWFEALDFANQILQQPSELDFLQVSLCTWWLNFQKTLSVSSYLSPFQ